jgi:hypothetical protein
MIKVIGQGTPAIVARTLVRAIKPLTQTAMRFPSRLSRTQLASDELTEKLMVKIVSLLKVGQEREDRPQDALMKFRLREPNKLRQIGEREWLACSVQQTEDLFLDRIPARSAAADRSTVKCLDARREMHKIQARVSIQLIQHGVKKERVTLGNTGDSFDFSGGHLGPAHM